MPSFPKHCLKQQLSVQRQLENERGIKLRAEAQVLHPYLQQFKRFHWTFPGLLNAQ